MSFARLSLLWKTKDLRNSLLFVAFLLFIFRVLAHIPLPGIDVSGLRAFFESSQLLGLLDIFSGGTLKNFSIIVLGVGPYITASIIMQLMTMIVPRLEELSKEGETGQKKMNQYTRYLTVPLAFIQGYSTILLIRQSQPQLLTGFDGQTLFLVLLTVTAGTVFLMWLGELISERKIGNGISILIFAGIAAGFPQLISQLALQYTGDWLTYVLFGLALIATVVGVVYLSEAQRNIDVVYARHVRGGSGGVASKLPIRVNIGGVVPIIFALSLVIFPTIVAQFLVHAKSAWLVSVAQGVIAFFGNQIYYGITYFVMVVVFSYFYTSIVFQPEKIAENMQRQGGFIPGIRPGKPTEDYIRTVAYRVLFFGSLSLGVIAVLPLVVQAFTGSKSLSIGGTSILIVVSVVIEIIKQIQSHLSMNKYDVV